MFKKVTNLLLLAVVLMVTPAIAAITITRVEPANWWVGMKKSEFQILVYGPNIGKSMVVINYPGVTLKQAAKVESPNYMFLYVNVAKGAKPGMVPIKFTNGQDKFTYSYPLKARTDKSGALGFNASDVLYLITPDRFANGKPENDNWDDVTVNRENLNARHGGDLEGVAKELDYMKDLGITTVWLNPIQENKMRGGSYHGYAITDFYKVDQRFGSNEEFRELTKATHQKGMKMVMDMVLNHCGSSHWWMADPPSKDWINNKGVFLQTNHATVSVMDVHASQTERSTFQNGWFTRGMPDLNQTNPHLATYLIQNSIWWIEYARIDGIRQDTYSYMDFDFLTRWNKEVYAEYPNFNIVGETWYKKSTSSAWWQKHSILSKRDPFLKTPMDFSLTFISQKAFDSKADNGYLGDIFEDIAQDFIYANPYNVLTFLDNHDLSRFNRKEDTDLKRYKQGLAFLLTMRGIPQLYYGTEILMSGTKEEGDGSLRKDFPGGWPGDKSDQFTKAGRTDLQNEAWDYLQKLLQWRKTNDAITKGTMMHYEPKNGIYVYGRTKGNHTVMVILNSAITDETVKMDRFTDIIGKYTTGKDVITAKTFPLSNTITIPAKGEYVLELSN
ncbi:glycoside hydrolase family 13 protein [Mucilaginibacter sp.]|uniref:glycoside hydrolase family 13 protein n=1 Tax=Mucilaginibacter sp. TaxID=1882438 RepID=UPI00260FA1AA|nr:glycoside hydrolase family 13 protein [Mucilaginibacter sp.]MDB5127845.1 glycoside hydrolase family 13, candidate alpha-glycosidase [Mucilaginibacter sp.]